MKYFSILILLLSFLSCKEVTEKHEMRNPTLIKDIDVSIIDNETDPICNMSVREHVTDTALINGKVWGFCSIVCKEKYVQLHVSK